MSSIYFDNVLHLNEASSVRCIAWSKGEDTPLIAVAEGNQVRIFRDDGEELVEAVQLRNAACSALAWHPRSKVLAAGWADGALTFAGPQSSSARDDREVHRDGRVLCIAFNPTGSRCVTTDDNGVVGVWKTDAKGMLSQMCHYRKQGAQDKAIFRTMTPTGDVNLENPPFFFGGEQGNIYLADDFGLCSERHKFGAPLMILEYFHQKDVVVVITKNVTLAQFSLDAEGKVVNETQQKLSCGPQPEKLQGVWAGPGLLATTSHESIVRLWNLADDENYILSLQGLDERNTLAGDKVTSIDFNPRKRVMACGTRGGRVVQWRCSTLYGTPKSESSWQVLPPITASECAIDKITWGPGENLFHIRTERSSVIMSEVQLNTACSAHQDVGQSAYLAVQTAPMRVLLYHLQTQARALITVPFRVKGLGLGDLHILLWSSKQLTLFEISDGQSLTAMERSTFKRENPITAAVIIVHGMEPTIALASGASIELVNLQGYVRETIPFSAEVEGLPMCLDISGQHLVAATTNNVIRVWKMSQSGAKEGKPPRKFEQGMDETPLGDIRSVRINNNGTRVSLLVDQRLLPGGPHGGNTTLRVPDSRLFIYDLESDSFLTYFVGKSHVPIAHMWDCKDARLMACEVVPQSLAYSGDGANGIPETPSGAAVLGNDVFASAQGGTEDHEPRHSVMTLFVSGSEKALQQDCIPCADPENGGAPRMPVALVVPHVYFARQVGDIGLNSNLEQNGGGNMDSGGGAVISRTTLRDFAGLENVDQETTTALLDFSYHLACGNTDDAYKSVKGVNSTGVWESMSKMCVKTGRLDVAQKCLGQMGHARAAGALRSCLEPEPEAKLAVVAVHLDLIEDAEHLYRKCARYDLLNQLYQACGEWEKALEIAKTKDRVHLKPTHFTYAQYLETIEDVDGALRHFELSGTYRTESPRLLCSLGMTDDLEDYVNKSEDTHLHRWYAQYLESKANLEGASKEYMKANDYLSLCRVACFNKDLDRAQKICEDSKDAAACYHLARHLESEGRIKEAIHFFEVAGRLSHALRLAQENNFDGDLMSLALASDATNMAQAAKYYEQRGQPSKAVVLYQKAGCQKRALELCFSARLFDALRKIADDLNPESDPEVLKKCAEFFMSNSQHDKAVHLLSMSHRYEEAVELCKEYDVQITEDMAERMTPDKSDMDQAVRSEILLQIAKLCNKQGSFQLACKKFTQAGDKLKAMKSLLKSGDTQKIIFFTNTARQADIYVLAGNYLQSLDWHNDPEIMKNIIQFYSKAKAHDKLASFYDACAQVEIDEYRDYEKAGGALREALKFLVKAAGANAEADDRVLSLQNRIAIVEKFAGIRKLAKTDPEQMVSICEKMLDVPEIETAVRIGDIFAQLVEHYAETRQFEDAHRTVERMQQRKIILMPYLDQALLQSIYSHMGLPVPEAESGGGGASGNGGTNNGGLGEGAALGGDELDEEIEEEPNA